MGLDPPIRHGQTRYPFMVLEFNKDETKELELGLSTFVINVLLCDTRSNWCPYNFSEQLEQKYAGKLEKNLSGPYYEVVARIMRALVNQRVTIPGSFVGLVSRSSKLVLVVSLTIRIVKLNNYV